MMLLEYCTVTGALLACALAMYLVRFFLDTMRQPPGPFGIPILGYLPFVGNHPARKYFELSKRYGPIISLKLVSQSFVVLNDYESINEAFARKGQYLSGRSQDPVIKTISKGYGIIFRDYNEDLHIQRRFFLKTLRGFGVDKTNIEQKVLNEVEYLLAEIESADNEPISCRNLLSIATANVINNVMLGSRYSYQDEEIQTLINVINQTFSTDKVNALCLNLLFVAPALRFIPPFSKALRNVRNGRKFVADTLRKFVEEHRQCLDPNNLRDFVDEFLVKMDSDDEGDSSFCENQLYEALTDLFVAGTETTSSTLAYAFLAFALYPDIQRKVHNEIVKIVGDGKPLMKHKKEMAYLSAFIHELSRHRTVTPIALPHCATEETQVMGYDIRKREYVVANLWAVHHDPKNFENPDEFRPERFIDDDGKFVNDRRVIPFSLGPRLCAGEHLAKAEVFLFITSVVQRFRIQADEQAALPLLQDDGIVGSLIVPKDFKVSFVAR